MEAADRWTKEYEAQQLAARGRWSVEVEEEEPAAPSYTTEEVAEMQAVAEATRAGREGVANAGNYALLLGTKRRRNH